MRFCVAPQQEGYVCLFIRERTVIIHMITRGQRGPTNDAVFIGEDGLSQSGAPFTPLAAHGFFFFFLETESSPD